MNHKDLLATILLKLIFKILTNSKISCIICTIVSSTDNTANIAI